MKFWKAAAAAGLLLAGTFVLFTVSKEQPVSASTPEPEVYTEPVPEEAKDNPFANLEEGEKIYPLPEGGFISGNGTVQIFSLDDLETPIETIDLDNDPGTVSAEEAYEMWNNQSGD